MRLPSFGFPARIPNCLRRADRAGKIVLDQDQPPSNELTCPSAPSRSLACLAAWEQAPAAEPEYTQIT